MRLILGSGSPRRLELLGVLGVTPDAILPPDIDEDPRNGELPRVYVERVAREKALAVAAVTHVNRHPRRPIPDIAMTCAVRRVLWRARTDISVINRMGRLRPADPV